MESQWYYTLRGQQQGPVPEAQIRSLLQSGQLRPEEFVFREGMSDWAAASSCPELMKNSAVPETVLNAPISGGSGLSMGAVYKEAIEIFKVQWLQLCLGVLVIGAPNMLLSNMGRFVPERAAALFDIASVIVTAPLMLGGWILFLNAVDRREVSVNQVWDGFQRFVPALIVDLIRHAPLLPGWVLMIVLPSVGGILTLIGLLPFFAMVLFMAFAYGFMADRNCTPVDAAKLSFNCVKDNIALVLVLAVMLIPLLVGGFILLFIGMIPAAAFWMLSLAVAYRWLNPRMPIPAA